MDAATLEEELARELRRVLKAKRDHWLQRGKLEAYAEFARTGTWTGPVRKSMSGLVLTEVAPGVHRWTRPDSGESHQTHPDTGEHAHDAATLAGIPDPAVRERAKGLVARASAKVNDFLLDHATAVSRVAWLAKALDSILTTPEDIQRYPWLAGKYSHTGDASGDAFSQATGVPGHLASRLLASALAAGWKSAKGMFAVNVVKALAGADLDAAAELVAGLLDAALAGIGLPPCDPEAVRAGLAEMGGDGDDDADPHDAVAEAMVELAHESKLAGEDAGPGLDRLRELLDDPAALADALRGSAPEGTVAKCVGLMVVRKAWGKGGTVRKADNGLELKEVKPGIHRWVRPDTGEEHEMHPDSGESADDAVDRGESYEKHYTPEQTKEIFTQGGCGILAQELLEALPGSTPILWKRKDGTPSHAAVLYNGKPVHFGDDDEGYEEVDPKDLDEAVQYDFDPRMDPDEARDLAKKVARKIAQEVNPSDSSQYSARTYREDVTKCVRLMVVRKAWSEDKHKRDHGKFASTGGSSGGGDGGKWDEVVIRPGTRFRTVSVEPVTLSVHGVKRQGQHVTVEEVGDTVTKAGKWDSSKHPRDKSGHFVSAGAIEDAKTDPAKAAELRERVAPKDAEKLEAALKQPVKGPSVTQKRGEAKERGAAILAKLGKAADLRGTFTADDLHALADHLADPAVTVEHLRDVRRALRANAMRAGFGGASRKDAMVAALVEHARGHAFEARLREQGITGADADDMRRAAGRMPKETGAPTAQVGEAEPTPTPEPHEFDKYMDSFGPNNLDEDEKEKFRKQWDAVKAEHGPNGTDNPLSSGAEMGKITLAAMKVSKEKGKPAAPAPAVAATPAEEPEERSTFMGRDRKPIHHEGTPLRNGDLLVEKVPDFHGGGERLLNVAHAHHDGAADVTGRSSGSRVTLRSSIEPNLHGFKRSATEVSMGNTRRATADDVRRLAKESGVEPPPEYLDPSRLAPASGVPSARTAPEGPAGAGGGAGSAKPKPVATSGDISAALRDVDLDRLHGHLSSIDPAATKGMTHRDAIHAAIRSLDNETFETLAKNYGVDPGGYGQRARNELFGAVEDRLHELQRHTLQPRTDLDTVPQPPEPKTTKGPKAARSPKTASPAPSDAAPRGLSGVLASHAAATGKARAAMDAALWNSDAIDDAGKPVKGAKVDPLKLARTLSSEWGQLHDEMTPQERDQMHAALVHAGVQLRGTAGEKTKFDGRYHEGPAGHFTGDETTLTRPGLVHVGADGRETIMVKGKAEKAPANADVADSGPGAVTSPPITPPTPPESRPVTPENKPTGRKTVRVGDADDPWYDGPLHERAATFPGENQKKYTLYTMAPEGAADLNRTFWAFDPHDTRGYAEPDRVLHKLSVSIPAHKVASQDDIRSVAESVGVDTSDDDEVDWVRSKKVRAALAAKGFVAANLIDVSPDGDYEHDTLMFLADPPKQSGKNPAPRAPSAQVAAPAPQNSGQSPRNPSTGVDNGAGVVQNTPVEPPAPGGGNAGGGKMELPKLQGSEKQVEFAAKVRDDAMNPGTYGGNIKASHEFMLPVVRSGAAAVTDAGAWLDNKKYAFPLMFAGRFGIPMAAAKTAQRVIEDHHNYNQFLKGNGSPEATELDDDATDSLVSATGSRTKAAEVATAFGFRLGGQS